MGFSRHEYCSGLPFPSSGGLADPGIEPRSSALQADALTSEPPGKPIGLLSYIHFLFFCQSDRLVHLFILFLKNSLRFNWTSLVAQTVKRLSTMRETQVRSLGWEDPLEKEMAIHSSTAAWKIPWTEEPGRLQSMGSQRVGHD